MCPKRIEIRIYAYQALSIMTTTCIKMIRLWKSCGTGSTPSKRSKLVSPVALCFWQSSMRSTLNPSPWQAIWTSLSSFTGQWFISVFTIWVTPAVDEGFSLITPRLTWKLCTRNTSYIYITLFVQFHFEKTISSKICDECAEGHVGSSRNPSAQTKYAPR